MPSQVMQNRRVVSGVRVPSMNGPPRDYGLLMSVKILPQSSSSTPSDTIKPLVPFSIEVFVHNRTDQVRRFRLIVPGREDGIRWEARVREVLERGMKKGGDLMGVGDEACMVIMSPHWKEKVLTTSSSENVIGFIHLCINASHTTRG